VAPLASLKMCPQLLKRHALGLSKDLTAKQPSSEPIQEDFSVL
jgi:hypothetical protein